MYFEAKRTLLSPNRKKIANFSKMLTIKKHLKITNCKNEQISTIKKHLNITNRTNEYILTYEKTVKNS